MSLDRTLKLHGGLIRSRSVLTRAERIAKLTEDGKFDKDQASPFGLAKVRVHHSRAGSKAKKAEAKPAEGVPVAEGQAAAAPGVQAPAAGAAKGSTGKGPAAKPTEGKGKGPAPKPAEGKGKAEGKK